MKQIQSSSKLKIYDEKITCDIDQEFILMQEALASREQAFKEDDEQIVQAYFYAQQVFEAMEKLGISTFSVQTLEAAAAELGRTYEARGEYKIVKFSREDVNYKNDNKNSAKLRNKAARKQKAPLEYRAFSHVSRSDRILVSPLHKYPYTISLYRPVDVYGAWSIHQAYCEKKHKLLIMFLEDLPVLMRAITNQAQNMD